jgi:hypothetical protein
VPIIYHRILYFAVLPAAFCRHVLCRIYSTH